MSPSPIITYLLCYWTLEEEHRAVNSFLPWRHWLCDNLINTHIV